MRGAFDSLMMSQPGNQPQIQATPVHHVGQEGSMDHPQRGSIKSEAMGFLSEVESHMGKFRPGSHAHNQLSSMRGQILMDIADMDVEHQTLGGNEGVQDLTTRMQNLKAKTHPYQRGITPEGKPVR